MFNSVGIDEAHIDAERFKLVLNFLDQDSDTEGRVTSSEAYKSYLFFVIAILSSTFVA